MALIASGGAGGWALRDQVRESDLVPVSVTVNRPVTIVSQPIASRAATMPDVTGLGVEQARQVLADAGSRAEAITTEQPYAGQPGLVVSQTPSVGAALTGVVALAVSSAADVPDVVGRSSEEARTQLQALGAQVTMETAYDAKARDGQVLKISPAPGDPLVDSVVLTVAEASSAVDLTALQALSSACGTATVSVDGEVYEDALACRPRSGEPSILEYVLNRKVTTFTAVVGVGDRSPASARLVFTVFADGRRVAIRAVRFGQRGRISVRIAGALRLKIVAVLQAPADASSSDLQAVWGDARLHGGQDSIDALVAESKR